MNAYLVGNIDGDDHAWYCSEECAKSDPGYGHGNDGPEETPVEGLACEREGCPVEDIDAVEYIDIRPTVEGTKALLAGVAREKDDDRVLWGLRFARACGEGWLEWYGEQLAEARGWKD